MTIYPENFQIHKPKKNFEEKINRIEIKEKILFELDSCFHSIKVVKNSFGKFIKYGETYQAGYINSPSYKGNIPYINYFLIPYLMNKNIKDIALIGLGSGILVEQLYALFNIKQFDIIDIEENILDIAKEYFSFQINPNSNTNFYLQDALIFLKEKKKKYDLIITDVAGNEGIDERFYQDSYLELIKKRLKKGGIFISNLPSSRDIFNKKNKLTLELLESYKKFFKNIDIYNGETSNRIFYKTFYNIDEIVFDITNLILVSSNVNYKISRDYRRINEIGVNIEEYLNDNVKKY